MVGEAENGEPPGSCSLDVIVHLTYGMLAAKSVCGNSSNEQPPCFDPKTKQAGGAAPFSSYFTIIESNSQALELVPRLWLR